MARRMEQNFAQGGGGLGGGVGGEGAGLLGSVVAGAVIGVAGLTWWLLSEAERRRTLARRQRGLHLTRLQSGGDPLDPLPSGQERPLQDRELHQKVQQLNEAIEAVRRQLEQLQPQG
jgi:hypothetical protein